MKVVGLITEYNPFHNGHFYHIKKAKEVTGADMVIVVMSGDFVQRGAPAILPKHLRAEAALKAGASLVLELPVCFATGSAEFFAAGAINLLSHLGCVDAVCFGSECDNLPLLEMIARVALDEPDEFQLLLKKHLANGLSFPLARQQALKEYLNNSDITDVLEQPNNILGIEYLKALYKMNSSIKPYTIKRIVSDYHDDTLKQTYSSASALRKLLNAKTEENELLQKLKSQVPEECLSILTDNYGIRYPIYTDDFSSILKYKLLTETKTSLTKYLDINQELANKIINQENNFLSFEQFCNLLNSKDITYTRISRCLTHILLDIKDSDLDIFKGSGYCQYARVLGFRKDAKDLLKAIKECSDIPLITKLSQSDSLPESARRMIRQDIFSANLYESVVTDKFKQPFIHEYKQQVVRI